MGPFRVIWRFIKANLIAGLLLLLPTFLTVWVTWKLWSLLDGSLRVIFDPGPETKGEAGFEEGTVAVIGRWIRYDLEIDLHWLNVPGAGLVALLLLLAVAGLIGRSFLGRRLIRLGEWVVEKIPIARTVYLGAKQLFEALLVGGESAFQQVALIEYPRRGIWALGFVTCRSAQEITAVLNAEHINVFVPTTPNPTSGFLLLIPRKELIVLDMSVEDAVKLIISGGIVQPDWPKQAQRKALGGEVMHKESPLSPTDLPPPHTIGGKPLDNQPNNDTADPESTEPANCNHDPTETQE